MKMTRLVTVFIANASLLVLSCDRSSKNQAGGKVPAGTNVLMITLDTTRADRLGFYGYRQAATPTLDALAVRAAVFDDAQTAVTLTLPSHATIMTGRYPREHGLRINGRAQLGDTHPTLATIFNATGYRTAAFVSTFVLDGGYGLSRGFAVYDDEVGKVEPGEDIQEAERPADAVTARALAWLHGNADQPFFCWIHYYDPHHPYAPPQKFRERHADPYDGEIAFVDSELAKVMDWLKSKGLLDRTLIVVAGDHGESFGEHGEFGHTTFVYETNLRVPLMFAHPKAATAGGRVAVPVSLVDVFPTILDLFGLPRPEGLMGRSLAAALSGGQPEARPCYAECENTYSVHSWAQQRALLTDAWKFVSSAKPELYDRRNDRGELRNLAGDRPEVVKSMRQSMEALYADMKPTIPQQAAQDQAALKRLESLGYVSGARGSQADEVLTPDLPDPKDMVDLMLDLKQVQQFFDSGRFSDAVPLLEKAVQRSPESVDILQRLGRAYMKTNRIDEAILTLQKALQVDAGYRVALRTLGDAFMHARRRPEAIEHYELALERFPDDPQTLYNLGTALLDEQRIDEAIARFREAVKLRPDYGDALVNLGAALTRKGALDDAEKVLQQATAIPATEAQAHYVLARLAAARSQGDRVFKHLEKAVELKPGYERAVEDLAGLYLRSGRTADAARILRGVLQHSPGNVPLSLTFAEILATSKHDELRNGAEALRLAEQAVLATQGKDLRAHATLAEAQAETGDFDAAVQSAQKALALAEAAANAQMVSLFQGQINEYRAKRPFRNPSF